MSEHTLVQSSTILVRLPPYWSKHSSTPETCRDVTSQVKFGLNEIAPY